MPTTTVKRPISNPELLAQIESESKRINQGPAGPGTSPCPGCDTRAAAQDMDSQNNRCHAVAPGDNDDQHGPDQAKGTPRTLRMTSTPHFIMPEQDGEDKKRLQEILRSPEFSGINLSDAQPVIGRLGLVVDDDAFVNLPEAEAIYARVADVRRRSVDLMLESGRVVAGSWPEHRASLSRASSGARTDTTSGQLSAGNWGWFEDVHTDVGKSPKLPSRVFDDHGGDDYGNFEEPDLTTTNTQPGGGLLDFSLSSARPLNDVNRTTSDKDSGTMAVTAPTYVLEESFSSQKLWKQTAGHRPPQPIEERAYFEQIWSQNFLQSQVSYQAPMEVLVASSPLSMSPYADVGFEDSAEAPSFNPAGHYHNPTVFGGVGGDWRRTNKAAEVDAAEASIMQRARESGVPGDGQARQVVSQSDGAVSVLLKGNNVFGTTVSKSFARADRSGRIDTISISIACYRVVQSKKSGKYAQFLVVYKEGSFQNTVGVWKRSSDFDMLARKVTGGKESCSSILAQITPFAVHDDQDENDTEKEILPNAITSWRLLKKRQRWFRCLDAGYLSLKVFLLERFLHDILFETSNPQILRDFIGVDFLQ